MVGLKGVAELIEIVGRLDAPALGVERQDRGEIGDGRVAVSRGMGVGVEKNAEDDGEGEDGSEESGCPFDAPALAGLLRAIDPGGSIADR